MLKKILVPLDGSEIGETALQYVEEMISDLEVCKKINVTLIRVLRPLNSRLVSGDVSYSREISISEEDMLGSMKQEALAYLEKSAKALRSKGVEVTSRVVVRKSGTSSAEEIIKAEEDLDVDLVAMSTHGRRGISRWAFGSVTEKVLRGGNVPVLVVRAKK